MQIFANTNGVAAAANGVAQPQDSGSSSGSDASSTNTATVTANDFLQLLVAEMKNQDPTANTDPNEYINQLVQVNSLEQLVQINQDLGGNSNSGTTTNPSGDTVANTGVAPAGSHGSELSQQNAAALKVASAMGAGNAQTGAAGLNGPIPTSGNQFDAIVAAIRGHVATAPTPITTSPAR